MGRTDAIADMISFGMTRTEAMMLLRDAGPLGNGTGTASNDVVKISVDGWNTINVKPITDNTELRDAHAAKLLF
jgi:hypothetical protein